MWKKLKRIIFGENDWKIVWETHGFYSVKGVFTKNIWIEKCSIYIQFSFSRNRYRIKTSGFHPKHHEVYKEALDMLEHFENQL